MKSALATIAVVPRERFSFAIQSLDNILATTSLKHELLYVDGGSPPEVQLHIARQAKAHHFRVLRTEQYLSPNQARNLAAANIQTKYVVYIDNDALVSPGWLEALVDCAEQTGAWVVGPVYCERFPIAQRIHMAGGEARLVEQNGRRIFQEAHRFFGESLDEIRPRLRREPTEQIEFHCALVRRDVFDRLGPLDEKLFSAAEHTDLCLLTRAAGGEVYVEPNSIVTYIPPPPLTKTDLPFYLLRWCDAWNRASVEQFRAKWNLTADDPGMAELLKWLGDHRRLAWHSVSQALRSVGRKPGRWIDKHLIPPIEQSINRRHFPTASLSRVFASVLSPAA